jgi:dTDP-4-amino-4,6-dideoxygalactose transaminase
LVYEIDETAFGLHRDQLLTLLKAEHINARRYFYPGAHRATPYANEPQYENLALPLTEALCERVLQLPIGALVEPEDGTRIARLLCLAHEHHLEIKNKLESTTNFSPR